MGNPGFSGSCNQRLCWGNAGDKHGLNSAPNPHGCCPRTNSHRRQRKRSLPPKPLLEKLRATSPELAPSHRRRSRRMHSTAFPYRGALWNYILTGACQQKKSSPNSRTFSGGHFNPFLGHLPQPSQGPRLLSRFSTRPPPRGCQVDRAILPPLALSLRASRPSLPGRHLLQRGR